MEFCNNCEREAVRYYKTDGGIRLHLCAGCGDAFELGQMNVDKPLYPCDEDDVEEGDDMCDLCMRSGIAIYRTTLSGETVCGDCEDEADELDAEYREEHGQEESHD